jgi:hypothetical protein
MISVLGLMMIFCTINAIPLQNDDILFQERDSPSSIDPPPIFEHCNKTQLIQDIHSGVNENSLQ